MNKKKENQSVLPGSAPPSQDRLARQFTRHRVIVNEDALPRNLIPTHMHHCPCWLLIVKLFMMVRSSLWGLGGVPRIVGIIVHSTIRRTFARISWRLATADGEMLAFICTIGIQEHRGGK